MSKGSRQRSFGKQFDKNFDQIFKRQPGFNWASELKYKFSPIAWDSNDDFHHRNISKTEFYELYEKSQSM